MLDLMFRYGRTLGLSTVMVLLMVAGCADFDNPLAPTGDEQTMQTEAEGNSPGLLTKRPTRVESSTTSESTTSSTTSSTEVISATPDYVKSALVKARSGGSIVINTDKFWYSLVIPRGALDQDTRITMTIPDGNQSLLILEPHGLQFKKLTTLEIYTKSQDAMILDPSPASDDPMDIYWYDDATGIWVAQGSAVVFEPSSPNWLRARLDMSHFSRWALGGDSPSSFLIQKYWYENYQYSY